MAREWDFIRRLRPHERRGVGNRLEIHVLDDVGRTVAVGHIDERVNELVIASYAIPLAVIEAAKRCEEGRGGYVGPNGNRLPTF